MYISYNKSSVDQGNCNECNHERICKFVASRQEAQAAIKEIKIGFGSPFKISCFCDNFQRKAQKQDTLFREKEGYFDR